MASLKRAAALITRRLFLRTVTGPHQIRRSAPRMISVSMVAVMIQTQAEMVNEKGSSAG